MGFLVDVVLMMKFVDETAGGTALGLPVPEQPYSNKVC
jgi:hypothetical protein